MNWTGGNLARHSRGRSGDDSRTIEMRHWAAMHRRTTLPRPLIGHRDALGRTNPSTSTFFPSLLEPLQRTGNDLVNTRLENKRKSPSNHGSYSSNDDGDSDEEFRRKRRIMLQASDWAGIRYEAPFVATGDPRDEVNPHNSGARPREGLVRPPAILASSDLGSAGKSDGLDEPKFRSSNSSFPEIQSPHPIRPFSSAPILTSMNGSSPPPVHQGRRAPTPATPSYGHEVSSEPLSGTDRPCRGVRDRMSLENLLNPKNEAATTSVQREPSACSGCSFHNVPTPMGGTRGAGSMVAEPGSPPCQAEGSDGWYHFVSYQVQWSRPVY